MFPEGIWPLLLEVIKSWQVIFITIVIILFIFLVNYVSRTYHRPKSVSKSKPQKIKTQKPKKPSKQEKEAEDNSNEALGLDDY